jgi:hypothetical protein
MPLRHSSQRQFLGIRALILRARGEVEDIGIAARREVHGRRAADSGLIVGTDATLMARPPRRLFYQPPRTLAERS